MKNKILIIFSVVVLLIISCMTFTACKSSSSYGENILTNSDFETVVDSKPGKGWVASDISSIKFQKNTHDDDYDVRLGEWYAAFNITNASYSYLTQTVKLEKNKSYEIKAYVKVDSVTSVKNVGFRFGFDTEVGFNGYNVLDKTDGWTTIVYYFTSGVTGDVKFTIGTGSTDNSAVTAVAYVDNVILRKVKEIPMSYAEENKVEVLKTTVSSTLTDGGSIAFIVLMSIATVLLGVLVYFGLRKTTPSENIAPAPKEKEKSNFVKKLDKYIDVDKWKAALTSDFALFIYVLVGTLLIRFIIAVCTRGMLYNITNLENAGLIGNKNGILSYYTKAQESTTTMGNALLYSLFSKFAAMAKIKTGSLGYAILARLPMILADIIIVYMIYQFAQQQKGSKSAVIYSAIYGIFPVFFFLSAFYAATEAIAIAFIVGMFMAVLNKNYIATSALYTASLFFSNYALIILPLVLIFEVYGIIKDENSRIKIVLSMIISFVVFYIFAAILTWEDFIKGDLFVYFGRMYKFFKNSAFLSSDSFGMYAVFGAANLKVRSTMIDALNWLFVIAMSGWVGYIYIRNKNRADLVINASMMFVLYSVIGAQSTIYPLIFGLAVLLIYLIIVPENRLYASLATLSFMSFVNMAQICVQSGYIGNISGAAYVEFAPKSAMLIIFSILTVLATFFYVYSAIDVTYYNQASQIAPLNGGIKEELQQMFGSKKKDKKTK